MKVFVTGGAGFIGSRLVESFVDRGDEVWVVDDLSAAGASRRAIKGLPYIGATASTARFVQADVRDERALRNLFACQAFDAVVHLAALVGVRASLRQPVRYRSVNVAGTEALLAQLRHERTRLIFASSSSVYGASVRSPFVEDQPLAPISPYAETKVIGERLCSRHHERFGTPLTCLRFFTVYGPGQREDMAISRFVRRCLTRRPIPLFGDATSARDYTFVDDVVDAISRAVDRREGFATYNVGSGRTVSLSGLVEAIGVATGFEPVVERLPPQVGDVPFTHADVSKASRELGYQPRTFLPEGLARYIEWVESTELTPTLS